MCSPLVLIFIRKWQGKRTGIPHARIVIAVMMIIFRKRHMFSCCMRDLGPTVNASSKIMIKKYIITVGELFTVYLVIPLQSFNTDTYCIQFSYWKQDLKSIILLLGMISRMISTYPERLLSFHLLSHNCIFLLVKVFLLLNCNWQFLNKLVTESIFQ